MGLALGRGVFACTKVLHGDNPMKKTFLFGLLAFAASHLNLFGS